MYTKLTDSKSAEQFLPPDLCYSWLSLGIQQGGTMFYLPHMEESFVNTLFQASRANSFPHQPQLQTIHFAAALDRFISDVEINIIEFVLLEEVRSVGAVALLQQVLRNTKGWLS